MSGMYTVEGANGNHGIFKFWKVPYIAVDTVRYSHQNPWPEAAAQGGSSLERINSNAFGDDPINWKARTYGFTPGGPNDLNLPPLVELETNQVFVSGWFPFSVPMNATIQDDGATGTFSIHWQQVSGPADAIFRPPTNRSQPSISRWPVLTRWN